MCGTTAVSPDRRTGSSTVTTVPCGGLAADPVAVPLLIGLGVTELSVPGAAVAETKALVRTLNLAQCQALAARALVAPDAAAVRALVQEQTA